MELFYSLCVYIIVVVIVLIFYCKLGRRSYSALILGLIFGQIVLNLLIPPQKVDTDVEYGSGYALYLLIQIGTPILVYIYAVFMGHHDVVDKV